jgi:uncharacterized damage-inducible protein DinB
MSSDSSSLAWPRFHWFDREFAFPVAVELFGETLERLRGTPARLEERLKNVATEVTRHRPDGAWSVRENVGHLTDLEALWSGRADDLVDGRDKLRPADLQNRVTHEAGHNDRDLPSLLAAFRAAREDLVERLEAFGPADAGRSALHPRLGTPMTVVDLAFFVAEHDDHHIATIARILQHEGDTGSR